MMRACSSFTTLVLAASAGLLAPSSTHACGGYQCGPGALLPAHDSIVPANALVLRWKPPSQYSQPSTNATPPVHLYRLQNGGRTEIPIVVAQEGALARITPQNPVAEGTQLVFESGSTPCISSGGERTSFSLSVGPSVSVPAKLGTLKLVSNGPNSLSLPVLTGECTLPFNVVAARFEFNLSTEAQALAPVLRHSLVVDGQERGQFTTPTTYPGGPPVPDLGGALSDVIFSLCYNERSSPSATGLAQGVHTVHWLTRLPDGAAVHSNELMVTLTCPPPPPDAGTTDAAVHDASSASDAGSASEAGTPESREASVSSPPAPPPDAGASSADAAALGPSPSAQQPFDDGPFREEETGCAVSIGRAPGVLAGWLIMLAGLLLWRRRMDRS